MVSIDEARKHLFTGFSRDRFNISSLDTKVTGAFVGVAATPLAVYLTAIQSSGLFRLAATYLVLISFYVVYLLWSRVDRGTSLASLFGAVPNPLNEDTLVANIIAGLLVGSVFGVVSLVSGLFNVAVMPFSSFSIEATGIGFGGIVFLYVIIIPIIEELFFGDFQTTSPLRDAGIVGALVYSVLYFVAFHFVAYGGVWESLVFVGSLRLVLGVMVIFFEGVLGNIIAHVIANGFAVLSVVLFGTGSGGGFEVAAAPPVWLLVLVGVVPLVFVLGRPLSRVFGKV